MSIPIVPGSEIAINTGPSAVQLNAGALNARFKGQQALAGAVEGIGEQSGGLAADLEKVRNTRLAADADVKMRAAQHSFLTSTQGDENEAQWADRAQQTYNQVRDDLYASNKVPPVMRAQLDQSLKSWGQTLQIKAATMAATQSINRATSAVRQSYEEAGRDGDAEGMANAVRLGRASKLDPVEMADLEQKIPRTLALTAIENGLRSNPAGTHELLVSGAALPIKDQNGRDIVPSKVFPQKELQSLVNAARTQTAVWQKGNMETLLQQGADPITGLVPDQVVQQKVQSGEIEPKAGQALIDAQDRKVKAQSKEDAASLARDDRDSYNVLQTRIHDPNAWGAGPDEYAASLVADAAGIQNAALRGKAINDANRQLEAVKKTGQIAQRPLETQIMELMRKDRETQGAMVPLAVADVQAADAKSHLFSANEPATPAQTRYQAISGGIAAIRKMTDDEVKATFGEKATKESVVQNINVHAARLENEMREWFKSSEGQKATFEQANAHRMTLERPYVMDAVRQTLAKKAPAYISTKEEFDALPPDAPFVFNGRAGTKN